MLNEPFYFKDCCHWDLLRTNARVIPLGWGSIRQFLPEWGDWGASSSIGDLSLQQVSWFDVWYFRSTLLLWCHIHINVTGKLWTRFHSSLIHQSKGVLFMWGTYLIVEIVTSVGLFLYLDFFHLFPKVFITPLMRYI
jgi:hypothetical protein